MTDALPSRGTATMKEVALRAGVALSSVSRVLNGHPDVSPLMRDRVLEAVAALGYEPDLLASSLRRGSTHTVGFIVSDIVNPLFADIFTAAERSLREHGYSMLLAQSEGDSKRDVDSLRLFRRRRVDALIVSIADDQRTDTAAELARLEVPVVLLDRELTGEPNVSAVLADHRAGVLRATEHLLELGHRRIALISGAPSTRPPRERLAGFKEGFARAGVPVPSELVRLGSFSTDFGRRTTEDLLRLADPPTALLAGGNLVFVGVIAALHAHDVRVGRDLALVTCDDVPLAQFHTPPITVVARDTAAMGTMAAHLLLEQLQAPGSEASPRVERLPTELVLRASTFPLR